MTDLPPEDDNELPPDELVTPDDIGPDPDDDDSRGGEHFAGEHPDEPDVAEQPHPDE